jgi:hypothetical protein
MAKKVKPFKEPKPDKAFKAMTAGAVLRDLKAKMPPAGKKPSSPPAMRSIGGRTGGGGRKKTAKTLEQLEKEAMAYGLPDAKDKIKRPADVIMKGKRKKPAKMSLKRASLL